MSNFKEILIFYKIKAVHQELSVRVNSLKDIEHYKYYFTKKISNKNIISILVDNLINALL